MTKDQAHAEAHRRWGTAGHAPGDRYGWTCLRRKSVVDRYEVGFMVRPGRIMDGQGVTITVEFASVTMGRGRSWEEALERAGGSKQP